MKEEIQDIHDNKTWTLVPKEAHMNIIGSKWVHKVKKRSDGSIKRCKAILVAQGFNQKEGADFQYTYSLVVKISNVRIILPLAVGCGWDIKKLDVRNGFLNDKLHEAASRISR